jgi:hypothetical protein
MMHLPSARLATRIGALASLLVIALPVSRSAAQTNDLYWVGGQTGAIHRMSLAGGTSEVLGEISSLSPAKFTVFDDKLYWLTFLREDLMQSDLHGRGAQPADPSALPPDVLLAVKGGVRNADGDEIFGLAADPLTEQQFAPAAAVAADTVHGKIYWAGGWNENYAGRIGRMNLDGSNPQTLFDGLGIQDLPVDLALDVPAGKMYWTNWGSASIQRANLDGTGLETLASGVDAIALALYPVPEPGSAAGVAGLAILFLARRRPRRRGRAAAGRAEEDSQGPLLTSHF